MGRVQNKERFILRRSAILGSYWDEMASLLGWDIPLEWIRGYIPYTEANKVYSSADIVIGLQNLPTQLTQRIYEILGSGGFLLTVDTPALRQWFKPGRDLITTTTPAQTLRLVRHYLEHKEERKVIQEQGMKTVLNHSYSSRAKHITRILIEQGMLQIKENETKGHGTITYYMDHVKEKYELYMIKPGDTLFSISRKLGISLENIRKLNALNSDLIFPDQYLKIGEK